MNIDRINKIGSGQHEFFSDYTREQKKALGSFYSPSILAEFIAETILSIRKPDINKTYVVVDPAAGDSVLLYAFAKYALQRSIQHEIIGIDIDPKAVNNSKALFNSFEETSKFILADGLYPTSDKSWRDIFPKGVDYFISNPPWGTDKSCYTDLSKDFVVAKGQFDIFDLFVESMIRHLNDGGCYAIIVPDSIYSQEHRPVREFLFNNSDIRRIVRVGEGFFDGANISASIIFGIKRQTRRSNKIICSHFSNDVRRQVLSGNMSVKTAVLKSRKEIPVSLMIDHEYRFILDISKSDSDLLNHLDTGKTIGCVVDITRGVELSKKGIILQCPACMKWFAEPKTQKEFCECPHCEAEVLKRTANKEGIISKDNHDGAIPIIVGEDIYRFISVSSRYISLDFPGINYKSPTIYQGSKILVRKTGVGITAGIDYSGSYVNQVVFIVKRKPDISQFITNEVILSVLNSRVITYFVLKHFGKNMWQTHPYITQADITVLPFPEINLEDERIIISLQRITQLVRNNSRGAGDVFPPEADREIEFLVSQLFNLDKQDYQLIYDAIASAQQMIPFQRLLNISMEDIFNGI